MKLYLIAVTSMLLVLTGLPAMAKDRNDHHVRHDGHHYSERRGYRKHHDKWSHKQQHRRHHYSRHGVKPHRHKHRGHYSHRPGWSKHYYGAHYGHRRQSDHYRCGHDHRGAYIVGGAIAGALINEHFSRSYRY